MKTCTILLAHGSTDPTWKNDLEKLVQAVRLSAPATTIYLAYLAHCGPSLDQICDLAATDQITQCRVWPLLLGCGTHVTREIPQLMQKVGAAYPNIAFELLSPLANMPTFSTWLSSQVLVS